MQNSLNPGPLKPLKRHPALIPLSHDHHEGLIAAQRLKRGDPAYRDCDDACGSIVLLWERELEFHFRQEEQHVFAPADAAGDLSAMIRTVLDQHAEMASMVDTCREGRGDDDLVRRFGALLERHIRFEERELFPLLQEHFREDELAHMGEVIRSERESGRPARVCGFGPAQE